MKRILLSAAIFLAICPCAFSWGSMGHKTVAAIAEKHLTPKAREALDHYLGKSIRGIASDADYQRAKWTMDLGFIPTNPEDARVSWLKGFDFSTPLNISPWSHSITVDSDFRSYPTDNLNGAYINNDAYYVDILAHKLRKNIDKMDKEEIYRSIALIVHFLGDMHCPMHIVYQEADCPVKGKIDVTFCGKATTLHKIWDDGVFTGYPKDYKDIVDMCDTAAPKEIRKICRGDVYKWAGASAEFVWPLHTEYRSGDIIPDSYPQDKKDYLLTSLRNGGYRLAKVLNWIFG